MRGAVKSVMVAMVLRGLRKGTLVHNSKASSRHCSFRNCSHGRAIRLDLLHSTHGWFFLGKTVSHITKRHRKYSSSELRLADLHPGNSDVVEWHVSHYRLDLTCLTYQRSIDGHSSTG